MIARAENQNTVSIEAEPLKLVPVSTTTGVMAWLPQQTVESLKSNGGGDLRIKIESDTTGWLTQKQATVEHMNDVDGLKFDAAKMRIRRAAERGAFLSVGKNRDHRIDPVSFRAWRLEQRERDLDGMEAGR